MSANNVDSDQTPHYVASDLGLHCLPMTFLRASWSEWVKCQITLYLEIKKIQASILISKSNNVLFFFLSNFFSDNIAHNSYKCKYMYNTV